MSSPRQPRQCCCKSFASKWSLLNRSDLSPPPPPLGVTSKVHTVLNGTSFILAKPPPFSRRCARVRDTTHARTHTHTHTHTHIGSTVGAYPRGAGLSPVEGNGHFFPSYRRLYLSSFSDTHTHTHTHTPCMTLLLES